MRYFVIMCTAVVFLVTMLGADLGLCLAASSKGGKPAAQRIEVSGEKSKFDMVHRDTVRSLMSGQGPGEAGDGSAVIKYAALLSGYAAGNISAGWVTITMGEVGAAYGTSGHYEVLAVFSGLLGGKPCTSGDADGSGAIDIDDPVYLLAYIFLGGPQPTPAKCCGDADGTEEIDIDDVIYLINYVFFEGSAPVDIC